MGRWGGRRGEGARRLLLRACAAAVLGVGLARGAVHEYGKDKFYYAGDAAVYRGGREGLKAAKADAVSPHRPGHLPQGMPPGAWPPAPRPWAPSAGARREGPRREAAPPAPGGGGGVTPRPALLARARAGPRGPAG